jgi:hypothetical protein
VRDRVLGTTTPIPRPSVAGVLANGCRESDVSDLATVLLACNFPTPLPDQVLLHIPGAAGTPFLVSSDSNDVAGDGLSGASVAMDASGLSMAFESLATNLVPSDANARADIFVLIDDGLLFGIFSDGFED